MNSRVLAIKQILDTHPASFFVFSNGLTARESAHFSRQDRCLYLLHAMGEALSVGVGLAKACPELEVIVVEGEGNALMGLASWSLMPMPNLHYYVLDNGCYETTGGQIVPPLPVIPSWCTIVPIAQGKANTPNPPMPADIWQSCRQWLIHNKYVKDSAQ